MLTWIGSVALGWVSAAESSIAPTFWDSTSTSSPESEPQAASATVANAAAESPTKLRRVGAKGKWRDVFIAVSSSGSVPDLGGAARAKRIEPVLRVRRCSGDDRPPEAG